MVAGAQGRLLARSFTCHGLFFLFSLRQDQLCRAMFPLGEKTKAENVINGTSPMIVMSDKKKIAKESKKKKDEAAEEPASEEAVA